MTASPTDRSDPSDPSDDAVERGLRASRRLAEPPEHVIQRALATWRPRRAVSTGLLQRVLAVLTFDSSAMPPLAVGMRSVGDGPRQLLFAAHGRDVDLRIAQAGVASWSITGQVLGPDCHGVVVLTDEHGEVANQADLDELGQFRLPPVPDGRYTVTLRLTDVEIALPAVQVPQAR